MSSVPGAVICSNAHHSPQHLSGRSCSLVYKLIVLQPESVLFPFSSTQQVVRSFLSTPRRSFPEFCELSLRSSLRFTLVIHYKPLGRSSILAFDAQLTRVNTNTRLQTRWSPKCTPRLFWLLPSSHLLRLVSVRRVLSRPSSRPWATLDSPVRLPLSLVRLLVCCLLALMPALR